MTGSSLTFSVVRSRALRDPPDQKKTSRITCLADDDSYAVTVLFHVRNCEVAVQKGGEALSHDEMPTAFFS